MMLCTMNKLHLSLYLYTASGFSLSILHYFSISLDFYYFTTMLTNFPGTQITFTTCFPSIKATGMTSDEFCEKLLYSKRVAIVPGTAFGESGEGFVRASYCYSVEHIKEALARIGEFLKEIK